MSISHTPGPWEAHGSDDGRGITWTVGRPEVGKHYTLARIYRPQGGNEQKAVAIANARLIAAAPDMLGLLVQSHKALRGMRIYRGSAGGNCSQCGKLWNGEHEKHHDNCLIVKIDAAISKATSRQPGGER